MKKIIIVIICLLALTGCDNFYTVSDPNNFDNQNISLLAVEYSNIALTYIQQVKEMVKNNVVAVFNEDSIYLVPVGSVESRGCSGIDDISPFGYQHEYAYVGVVKTGKLKTYYFVSRDAGGNGFNLTSEKLIKAGKGKDVKTGNNIVAISQLKDLYDDTGLHDNFKSIPLEKFDDNGTFSAALGKNSIVKNVNVYYYNVCK